MIRVSELIRLVGASGLDALDRASHGELSARLREGRREHLSGDLDVAYDERDGTILLGFRVVFADGPEPIDRVLGLGTWASLTPEARAAMESLREAQRARTGQARCADVSQALARIDEDDTREVRALEDDLRAVLRKATAAACFAAWHRDAGSLDLHELVSEEPSLVRVELAECMLLSPLSAATKRWTLVRARELEELRRRETITEARAAFSVEHMIGAEGLADPALDLLDRVVDAQARIIHEALADAPARSSAFHALLEALAEALRHHARAEVARSVGAIGEASASAAKADRILRDRLKDLALDALMHDLDSRTAGADLERAIAPLADAYLEEAFEDFDDPPFEALNVVDAFGHTVARGFWNRVHGKLADLVGGKDAR
jgi:hypothetical protein